MDHVAIMKKEWKFIEKILTKHLPSHKASAGQRKTIESRWYQHKYQPWDHITKGDIVYFKNSGQPVVAMAKVKGVMQFADLNSEKVKKILQEYGSAIGIEKKDSAKFLQKFRDKKYCILVFLSQPKKVPPFLINKKGFGAMASWVSVKSILDIKV